MLALGVIGIIAAVAFIVIATMKDWDPAYSLIVVIGILAITNGMNFENAWLTTMFEGSTDMFISTTPVLICGIMFAGIFSISGAARKIAFSLLNFFTRLIKPKPGREVSAGIKITICVSFAITFVFQYFGVDGMVQIITLFPLVAQMLKKYNLPRKLMPTLLISGSMLVPAPFSPNFQNVMSAQILGTTTGAGLVPGIVACCVTVVLNFILIHRFFLKERETCEWNDLPNDSQELGGDNMPHLILSLIPVVGVFAFYQLGLQLPTSFAICTALEVVLFYPQLRHLAQEKQISVPQLFKEETNHGVKNAMYLSVVVSLLVGYGSVITSTEAFQMLIGKMTSGNGHALLISMVVIFLITVFVACNPVAGFFANITQVAPYFIEAGIPAVAVHRLNLICVTVFDSLPTASGIIASVKLCGCSMKESYRYLFVTTVIVPLLSTIIMTLLFMTGAFY